MTSEAGGPLWKLIPARMCEKLVGLGEVDLVGINDPGEGAPLEVVIGSRKARPVVCGMWWVGVVEGLSDGGVGGFTGVRPSGSAAVAETPLDMSEHRLCAQVVHRARPHDWSPTGVVDIPSGEVGDHPGGWAGSPGRRGRRRAWLWVAYGEQRGRPLGRSPVGSRHRSDRRGPSCGHRREALFWRKGRWRTKVWCTSVVDVGGHQLIDIVPGKTAESAAAWFRSQPADWLEGIRWAVSGHVRFVSEGV